MTDSPRPAAPPAAWHRDGNPDALPRRNGMAIAALVCGVAALFTAGITSVAAVPLGHTALRRIKTEGERGRGMAIAGVVCGWACIAVWALYWVSVIAQAA